jgi:hypothetical protein
MSAGYVVPDEWMALADTVLVPGKPLSTNDLRRALAAVIPAIQAEALERAAMDVAQWAAAVEAKAPALPTIIQAHMHAAAIRALKEPT